MGVFNYKAKSFTGGQVNGIMEAENEKVLAAKLKAQKLILLSAVLEKKKKASGKRRQSNRKRPEYFCQAIRNHDLGRCSGTAVLEYNL